MLGMEGALVATYWFTFWPDDDTANDARTYITHQYTSQANNV
jgi:hypothetical protein